MEKEHEDLKTAYKVQELVRKIAKRQLKQALPDSLLAEIEDEYTGLNAVDVKLILQHCFDRKGKITETMISENQEKLKVPFDLEEGFLVYCKCIEDCQQFATDANDPFSDAALIWMGIAAITKLNLFKEEHRAWMKLPRNDRNTWNKFKIFWNDAINDFEEYDKLTRGDGAFEANTIEQGSYKLGDAIKNLAHAAASDKLSLAQLINTNANLETQLRDANATIKRLAEENFNQTSG